MILQSVYWDWKASGSTKEKPADRYITPAGKKWVLTNLPVRCIVTDVEICYKAFSQMVVICENCIVWLYSLKHFIIYRFLHKLIYRPLKYRLTSDINCCILFLVVVLRMLVGPAAGGVHAWTPFFNLNMIRPSKCPISLAGWFSES